MKFPQPRSVLTVLSVLFSFSLCDLPAQNETPGLPGLALTWQGQSSEDHTGGSVVPIPNGINDLRISVDSRSLLSSAPVQWSLHGESVMRGRLDWEFPTTVHQFPALYVESRGSD